MPPRNISKPMDSLPDWKNLAMINKLATAGIILPDIATRIHSFLVALEIEAVQALQQDVMREFVNPWMLSMFVGYDSIMMAIEWDDKDWYIAKWRPSASHSPLYHSNAQGKYKDISKDTLMNYFPQPRPHCAGPILYKVPRK